MCSNNKVPQWSVLHGLISNAIYGGRIDDPQEALKLSTYLSQIFNDDVFNSSGKSPSKTIAKGVSLPNSMIHKDYMKLIVGLNETENGDLFGLPGNIEGILQVTLGKKVTNQLKGLVRRGGREEMNESSLLNIFLAILSQRYIHPFFPQ